MSRKFNTKTFLKDIFNDKYALVIGNEIILDSSIEPTHDVHNFFLRKVNDTTKQKFYHYNDIALDITERKNPVRQLIEDGEITFTPSFVSHDLKSLLATKLFTTILTTTTDEFLESALREIWGDELRVVNVYDKESVDEFQNSLKICRRGQRYNQPTLIYVFGKLVPNDLKMRYVKTDADAILLIEKWMRMDIEANNALLDFIRSKRLLALGCKYDNWYFRFFWYVLTGVTKSEENDYDGRGEVAFSLDKTDNSEIKLLQFLDRTDICILGDAKSFIQSISNIFSQDSQDSIFRQQVIESRSRGGIFISYCSKDALSACQLFFQLKERKFNVWLDNARLYGGDNYENEIADAISSSSVVITMLSPYVADDLKKEITDRYYQKEWKMAQQFGDKRIIPLAINGYDLRSPYHINYEKLIGSQSSGINLMDADGFSKLITSILENS
ncbi:MAG: toll/interleukin-1 receptor domain-containing protein [Clostridium sp.]|nr:toll/interleukin-1 receptor domain-containing protein [Clostridium sp.]